MKSNLRAGWSAIRERFKERVDSLPLQAAGRVELWDSANMNAPQPISPRDRLQQLLAIPERQRTDAQWDEINDLEIKLAAGNRESIPAAGARRGAPITARRPNPGGGTQGKKSGKNFTKRPPKGNAP